MENNIKYRFSSTPPLVLVNKEVIEERGLQANLLGRELMDYNVLLRDLINMEIPYSIKNELLNIAFYVVNDIECYDKFKEKKDVPIKEICENFAKPKSFIHKWKDILISYIIILGDGKYKYIQDYLMVEECKLESKSLSTAFAEKTNEIKGIVISAKGNTARIITSDGEFKSIKVKVATVRGEEATGKVKKKLKDFKVHLSILASLFVILIGIITFNYINVSSTIMVKTTSPIILEINNFKRVKTINSITEKGTIMIENIKVLDRSFDKALIEIIKYAKENEMMPREGIIVTVNGKPIEHGDLHKTEDYIFIEQIDVSINNSGLEYKLN